MVPDKVHIIRTLQKAILPLQGIQQLPGNTCSPIDLGPINQAFPNKSFITGAVHEFFCNTVEDAAATGGFIAGLLSALMQNNGIAIWISSSRTIFPPALVSFGIAPDKVIFIDLHNEKDARWAMEEALKSDGLSAVVSDLQELSFIGSRRLQLAVEKSRVTGFVIRRNPRHLATACVTRWKITSLASATEKNRPGVGFPRWNVELLKVRNGQPGAWQVEWVNKTFRHAARPAAMIAIASHVKKKTG